MERIVAPIGIVRKLSGVQVPSPQVTYVRSQHCLELACDDGRLLYHVMTGELLHFDEGESLDEHREALIAGRFLVPDDFDECAHALHVRKIASLLQRDSGAKTSFTILTTTDCNARCAYCYERDLPRTTMSRQVAADVADYLARVSEGRDVSIHWFGGEPLYNSEAIDIICQGLVRRGVPFSSHMTSNGYYLDAQTSTRAKQLWNLEHVQITLDGTEERYNRTKAFADAQGSAFRRVLANIDGALDAGIAVYVRLNMDARNADDLLRLCDVLAERYAGRPGLKVHVQPLRSLAARVHEFDDADVAFASYKSLMERLEASGLAMTGTLPRRLVLNHCMADRAAAEVILPDGAIAKCEHVDPTEHLGTIYDSWRDLELLDAWSQEDEPREQCTTCPLLWRCNRLARCAWWKSGCDDAMQRIRRYNLERTVRAAYEAHRASHPTMP